MYEHEGVGLRRNHGPLHSRAANEKGDLPELERLFIPY